MSSYYFHKLPVGASGVSSGGGVTVIAGLGQWVLLHNPNQVPKGAVKVDDVVVFLETKNKSLNALRKVASVLADFSDVEDGPEGPRPNWAMSLLSEIEPTIAEAEGSLL